MSLFGALSLGASSLAAQQTALQVTGNNIANSGTAGYTREVVNFTPSEPEQVAPGQFAGTGVTIASITRAADASVNESLRNANSDQNSAQTLSTLLNQIQTTFGTLGNNDISSQLTNFFNDFSTLADNPSDAAQQSVVVQDGQSLAENLQDLRGQLTTTLTSTQTQASTLAQQANTLASNVANLNQQIAGLEAGTNGDNSLEDQRDEDLTQLSQIMNIHTVDQGNGQLNVYVGSEPLVMGSTSRGVSSEQVSDPTGTYTTTQVTFADNGDPMDVTGGQLGALTQGTGSAIVPAIQAVDSMAAGLINAVNSIYSQGQAQTNFSSVTGATDVTDPTAALNAGTAATGIPFAPQNGTFNLYIDDNVTGQVTTQQIAVNLSGQGPQTSLNSLAASITAAGGGVINASVTPSGNLSIASNNNNVTFSFGQDTSGALASLGVNTFFTGSDASNIGVNSVVTNDPSMLATGRDNVPGSNTNAQALSLAGSAAVAQLGGKSLTDYYTDYVGNLAAQAQSASDNSTTQSTVYNSIYAQQQSISGVSMDEEAVNLTAYQRAFEGAAQYISVVNELMQTVLAMVPAAT